MHDPFKYSVEPTVYCVPAVAATLIIGGMAGGIIGGLAAEATRQETLQEVQHDVEAQEILFGEDRPRTQQQARLAQRLSAKGLKPGDPEWEKAMTAFKERPQDSGQVGEKAELARTQATESHEQALAHLEAELGEARSLTYEQQRGTQLEAAGAHEQILVENELAMGQTEAQLGTSGVRRSGSVEEILQSGDLGGERRVEQLEQSLEEREKSFDTARGRLDAAAGRERESLSLAFSQTMDSISQAESHALETGTHELDWMKSQLAYLDSFQFQASNILSGVFSGAQTSLNLAKDVASFF